MRQAGALADMQADVLMSWYAADTADPADGVSALIQASDLLTHLWGLLVRPDQGISGGRGGGWLTSQEGALVLWATGTVQRREQEERGGMARRRFACTPVIATLQCESLTDSRAATLLYSHNNER